MHHMAYIIRHIIIRYHHTSYYHTPYTMYHVLCMIHDVSYSIYDTSYAIHHISYIIYLGVDGPLIKDRRNQEVEAEGRKEGSTRKRADNVVTKFSKTSNTLPDLWHASFTKQDKRD